MKMLYKEDLPEAQRRWDAFWHGEIIDRPCMMVTALVCPSSASMSSVSWFA